MAIKVIPIDLFLNISGTYDQTKTSRIGRLTNKSLEGLTALGPPIVQYRNTVALSEAFTPNELHFTDNNRVFVTSSETGGLVTVAAYDINPTNGAITYIGKLNMNVKDTPATTHAARGLRVIDDGVTGWKIFWLSTANQAANAGLYMANDIALADFSPVPINIPLATLGGQKAVYKLEDPGNTITAAAGISLDKTNGHAYVHNGVAATHQFYKFNYNATITTVVSGSTSDAFLFVTGNLPALTGTLLLTNSEEYHIPAIGLNAGQPCVIFHTTTQMYRGRLSDLTNGGTSWPTLEFQNNNPGTNTITVENTSRASFADNLKRVILLTANNVLIVKQFLDNSSDFYTVIEGRDNDEATVKEMYNFRVGTVQGIDSRNGFLAILSTTTGQRGLYIANFDCNNAFDSTHIISPVIDVANTRLFRVTAGVSRPDKVAPPVAYYRTSGFGTASGGWIAIPPNLIFNGNIGIISPTGQIQIKLGYQIFSDDKTNPLQINSFGLIAESENSISDNWEFSHDDSSSGNPSRVSFRLKKAYSSSVPNLFFRAFDLSDTLVAGHDTSANPSLFEYSTDGGVNWNPLGTIPNTVGTLVRYTFSTPPGVDIRPSIRES
jgi:hypothetical protein